MKSNFNNQQFVDRFSESLTIINKRTTERNIAICAAVVLGVGIVGYIGHQVYQRSKKSSLVKLDTVAVTQRPDVATSEEQPINALPQDQTIQNFDGVTRFAEPGIINRTDMYAQP